MLNVSEFKQLIQAAAQIREDSFDHDQAEQLDANCNQYGIDYTVCYKLTILEAAIKACKELNIMPAFAQPVYLLLTTSWNDALEWSEVSENNKTFGEILKEQELL